MESTFTKTALIIAGFVVVMLLAVVPCYAACSDRSRRSVVCRMVPGAAVETNAADRTY
jgi:hypothetical protein